MPRAPHGVADGQSLGERSAVMGAGGTDREELLAAAHQEDSIIANMSGEHASIRNITERDAPPEIGPLRLGLLSCHGQFLDFLQEIPDLDNCSARSINAGLERMFRIVRNSGNVFHASAV